MSKFHDEFFRQKGSDHDELIMKAVSKAGKQKIFDTLKLNSYCVNYILKENFTYYVDGKEIGILNIPFTIEEDYETELLCKSKGTGFIIGYADILFKILFKGIDFDYKRFFTAFAGCRCLVEVKPELNDIGAVLRQLKTYANLLKIDFGGNQEGYRIWWGDDKPNYLIPGLLAIVTYSDISTDVRDYLLHEGVHVIKF